LRRGSKVRKLDSDHDCLLSPFGFLLRCRLLLIYCIETRTWTTFLSHPLRKVTGSQWISLAVLKRTAAESRKCLMSIHLRIHPFWQEEVMA
jgi:hypothetical protein